MKQCEAKRLVIETWDKWIEQQPLKISKATGRESLKFFYELQDARSPLLAFSTRGRDKWPIVHAWLVGEGRVAN